MNKKVLAFLGILALASVLLVVPVNAKTEFDTGGYVQAPYPTSWTLSYGPWEGEVIKDGAAVRWCRNFIITKVGSESLRRAVLVIIPFRMTGHILDPQELMDNVYVTNNNGMADVYLTRVWHVDHWDNLYANYRAYYLQLGTIEEGQSAERVVNFEVTTGISWAFLMQVWYLP